MRLQLRYSAWRGHGAVSAGMHELWLQALIRLPMGKTLANCRDNNPELCPQPHQEILPQPPVRVQAAFDPLTTVMFALEDNRIIATGSAPLTWIQRARASSRMGASRSEPWSHAKKGTVP